jgi:ferredoxin-NADP reductase/Na+-translocating ferredoxin:NAD+ oxidoreductase RnfD subunit
MIKYLDYFLNRTTMYRLVLYYLILLLAVAIVFSGAGILPFNPLVLLLSAVWLVVMCWAANTLLADVFKAPVNVESAYITALILALIITPKLSADTFLFLGWAAILAMAAKYLLAINSKHLFNPAAVAVVITALALNQSASWWIGTASMAPFVLTAGLLIIRKIRRPALVISFLIAALASIGVYTWARGSGVFNIWSRVLIDTPLFFFACVMLTEPLTTPPTRRLQIIYGVLVGMLFAPQNHLGPIYSTPELALVVGNVWSYLVSPKMKLRLKFKAKVRRTPDIYDFVFAADQPLAFAPGQYLEWTLEHDRPDSRGNRRYFTVASSPTEPDLIMGVKFYDQASSFKRQLYQIDEATVISAAQLAGDFTLPEDRRQKLAFIAGGIGVTPFRSMIKYLLDTKERRDIVLFYSARTAADLAYSDIFEQAERQLGIKVVYVINEAGKQLDEALIRVATPDFLQRTFYISGPRSLVDGFKKVLIDMGVERRKIKTDFFPGFA